MLVIQRLSACLSAVVIKMEKELLECVLKKSWKATCVSTIMSMESSPAVGIFQNFCSIVTRIKMQAVLANGRVAKKSLILKNEKPDKSTKQFEKKHDAFKVEVMMYLTVLKEMEYLMEEFEDTSEILWCNLIHYIPYTCMVLEDLKESGFKLAERTEFFDLDKSLLAVTCLGRYHAMTKILEERGLLSKDAFKNWQVPQEKNFHKLWIWNINALVEGIRKYWDPSWTPLVDRMKLGSLDEFHEKLKPFTLLNESKFNVFNHGDLNKNNIMFRHNWKQQPVAMKFLDFQTPHYNTPCCDLMYLLYMCGEPSIRRDNMDLFVRMYHESLTKTLDLYRFSGTKPSLEEIKEGMEKYYLLGILVYITSFPAAQVSAEIENYFDIEKIKATDGKEGYNLELYNFEIIKKSVGPDLKIFIEKNF